MAEPNSVGEFISWLNQNISRLEAHANLNNLDCIAYVETWRDAHAWASEHLSHPDVEALGPQPIPYIRVPGRAAIFGLKRLRDHLTGEQHRTGQSKGDKLGNKLGNKQGEGMPVMHDPYAVVESAARSNRVPLCPQWLDNPGAFPPVCQPPPSVEGIQDAGLRQRAIEAWMCARRLFNIIDVWSDWFRELTSTGDADPGAFGRLRETAYSCLRALWRFRADIPSLRRDGPEGLSSTLPVLHSLTPGEWQRDKQFIEEGQSRLNDLLGFQGELNSFMTLLANSPSSAFLDSDDGDRQPPRKVEQAEWAEVGGQAEAEQSEGNQRKSRKGRKPGSKTTKADTKLYQDWKAAHNATGLTKAEFVHGRGLPPSALASLERGRANVKRKKQAASGRKPLDESSQGPSH